MRERDAVVDVKGLSKTFRVPKQHVMTIKERALHPFRRIEVDELHALRDVSFQILDGEFFGIVGRNGSGKSTLLKCLAGIYSADRGRILIAGRVAPFIELGVGFNPDLTALDNVVINGVMMGLTPREARRRFDEIIAFAELEEFLDLKLKNYSSGMQVRLAFSVMVQSDAEMLLIDEVLAVGDAAFQQKCLDQFHLLRDAGRTIVLVTHDMLTIERFCHRAMLLETGRLEEIGEPREIRRRYLELNFGREEGAAPARDRRWRGLSVAEAWVQAADGGRADALAHGEPLEMHALIDVEEPIEDARIWFWLDTDRQARIFAGNTDALGLPGRLEAGQRLHLRVAAPNALADGRYYVGWSATRGTAVPEEIAAFHPRACDFTVHGAPPDAGLVSLEHTVTLESALAEAPR